MARVWRLWELHEGENSAVLECVLGHRKRREGGGRCCRAAPFVDRWLFFGELFGGGACVGIGSVCMYCTEYCSNNHPVLPNPKPTHLSVIHRSHVGGLQK